MLCLTTLFVSCDQGSTAADNNNNTVETTQETTEEVTTEAVIEDVEPDYSSIIADWNTHLQFNKPQQNPTLINSDISFLFTDYERPGLEVTVNTIGNLTFVEKTIVESIYNFEIGAYEDNTKVEYAIYNTATGAEVYTATIDFYNPLTVTNTAYTYDFDFFGGIFEVTVGTLETVYDEYNVPTQEYVYSYSYYNNDGDALVSNLNEEIHSTASTENGDTLFYLSNKCYLLRNEEIFYVFDKGQERTLPYVDFEYLGFKYVIENDIYRVFDEEYNLLSTYTVPSVDNLISSAILSNGNLFFQIVTDLPDDAVDFDIEQYGYKATVKSILVDVNTGKATDLQLNYLVYNIVTNANDNGTNISVNNGNQYAEVYTFADGKLAPDCSFVILDNNMAVVAELPRILKNQTVGTSFLSLGNLLIPTDAFGENVYYTVDLATKDVNLFVDIEDSGFDALNFGFIYGENVYNNNFTALQLLHDNYAYTIYGGDSVLFSGYSRDLGGNYYYRAFVIYVTENGESIYNDISSRETDNIIYNELINCYFVYSNDGLSSSCTVYNAKGAYIASADSITIENYSEDGVTFKMYGYDSWNSSYYNSYYFYKY